MRLLLATDSKVTSCDHLSADIILILLSAVYVSFHLHKSPYYYDSLCYKGSCLFLKPKI